jgi:hypothetical protein
MKSMRIILLPGVEMNRKVIILNMRIFWILQPHFSAILHAFYFTPGTNYIALPMQSSREGRIPLMIAIPPKAFCDSMNSHIGLVLFPIYKEQSPSSRNTLPNDVFFFRSS